MITCDSGMCKHRAVYACTVKLVTSEQEPYVRLYCDVHVKELFAGIAEILTKPGHDGETLHQCIEVEHIG